MILEQKAAVNGCSGLWRPTGSTGAPTSTAPSLSWCLTPLLKQEEPKAAYGWKREDNSTQQRNGEEFTLSQPLSPSHPEASTPGAQNSNLYAV